MKIIIDNIQEFLQLTPAQRRKSWITTNLIKELETWLEDIDLVIAGGGMGDVGPDVSRITMSLEVE